MKRVSMSHVQARQGSGQSHELRGVRRNTAFTRPTAKLDLPSEVTQQQSKAFVAVWSTPTSDDDSHAESDDDDDGVSSRSISQYESEHDLSSSINHRNDNEEVNVSVEDIDADWLVKDELLSESKPQSIAPNDDTKEEQSVAVEQERSRYVVDATGDHNRLKVFIGSSSSPSARPNLTRSGSIPQLSPTKPLVRKGSVDDESVTSSETLKRHESNSISAQFWVADASKRSSRLLDEWKRKEIWHDFKRAQENVLTQPVLPVETVCAVSIDSSIPAPQNENSSVVNQSASVKPIMMSQSTKSTSVNRLDDLLQNLRSEGSLPSRDVKQIRRATAFSHWSGNGFIVQEGAPQPKKTGALEALMAVSDQTLRAVPQTMRNLAEGTPLGVAGLVSKVDYDQLLQEKRRLADEVAISQQTLATEREALRSLNEKILNFENSERENRFLKEEIQRHLMQELSSKELIRALEDQMSLTSKSEEQLKLQTRQLMQQNQTLQADLLDKIASETVKIQKMAQLSAEKQNLLDEWQKKDSRTSQKEDEAKIALRDRMIVRFTMANKRQVLSKTFLAWVARANELRRAKALSIRVLSSTTKCRELKSLARAFARMRQRTEYIQQKQIMQKLQNAVDGARLQTRELGHRAGLTVAASILQSHHTRTLTLAFASWTRYIQDRAALRQRLEYACAKVASVHRASVRSRKSAAFATWKIVFQFQGLSLENEQAQRNEKELVDAKDCIFSLSRAKARLEETIQSERDESHRLADQLREHRSELQLVKHGFVATVMRSTEHTWLRSIFTAWRVQSGISACEREFRLQIEMAEHKAAERANFAQSLDDYNKVLRNDLERFQYFSQDKRITVDVLTKKLLREEDKLKRMEEQKVILEEKLLANKAQLTSMLDSHGATLPMSLMALCKDVAVANLMDIFRHFATKSLSSSIQSEDTRTEATIVNGNEGQFLRVSLEVLVELCQTSSLGTFVPQGDVASIVYRHAPDYATSRGIPFAEFVSTVSEVLKEVYGAHDHRNERSKEFWMSLLSRVHSVRNNTPPVNRIENGDTVARSPWGGQLTEEILQNQEKLLAVLEHETAAAERVVMEKTSLKHAYVVSPHTANAAATSSEYQCDPVVPLESQPSSSQTDANFFLVHASAVYANWMHVGQVQDLFIAFQLPLQRVLSKYTNGNGNKFHVSDIYRMLEDMKLYPTFLSSEMVVHHTSRHCDRDGFFSPDALGVFLGNCAIELFASSPPVTRLTQLSAREIVLSFFCDLGLLAESDMPASAQICFVGSEIENVLWSLFEYYSISDKPKLSDVTAIRCRVGMDLLRFRRFMEEIANSADLAEQLFNGVVTETRRLDSSNDSAGVELHFDEFYVAIARFQHERNPMIRSASLGDAVRQWMEQTQ